MMNDNFEDAIKVVLGHEGSDFVDNPSDSGGPTKFGITQNTLIDAGIPYSREAIENLSIDQAKAIYAKVYWCKICGIEGYLAATCVFDQSVLAGIGTVAKIIQTMLGLKVDAQFGPLTISAINKIDIKTFCFIFLRSMNRHYSEECKNNPKNIIFFDGWEDRVFDLLHLVFI